MISGLLTPELASFPSCSNCDEMPLIIGYDLKPNYDTENQADVATADIPPDTQMIWDSQRQDFVFYLSKNLAKDYQQRISPQYTLGFGVFPMNMKKVELNNGLAYATSQKISSDWIDNHFTPNTM